MGLVLDVWLLHMTAGPPSENVFQAFGETGQLGESVCIMFSSWLF